ncbi:UNVERIFIED_CONTAM: hypothetical protein GTU68_036473 [Idotea baltica]|nr:hypothetical protein [Idotea baltica]
MLVHQDKRFKCPFRDTLGCNREFRRNGKEVFFFEGGYIMVKGGGGILLLGNI